MNLGVTMVFAIVAVILALSLKSKNPEYSTFISVAVCLVLLFICVSRMRVMLSGIEVLTDKIRMDSTYLVILVKLIGKIIDDVVAYTGQKAEKIATAQTLAQQMELFLKRPDKITVNFTTFKDNITSLGTAILNMSETKLDVDYIEVNSVGSKVPEDKACHRWMSRHLKRVWQNRPEWIRRCLIT